MAGYSPLEEIELSDDTGFTEKAGHSDKSGTIPRQRSISHDGSAPRHDSAPHRTTDPRFQLDTSRPGQEMILLTLRGEFDQYQVPRLRELLELRLRSMVRTVIVDCSQLSFICVDALELLSHEAYRAGHGGIRLGIATGTSPAVRRGCGVAGLNQLATVTETVEPLLETMSPASTAGSR